MLISAIISIYLRYNLILVAGKLLDLHIGHAILMGLQQNANSVVSTRYLIYFYIITPINVNLQTALQHFRDAGLCCVLRAQEILIFSKSCSIGTHGSNSKITIFPESDCTPPCPALIRFTERRSKKRTAYAPAFNLSALFINLCLVPCKSFRVIFFSKKLL